MLGDVDGDIDADGEAEGEADGEIDTLALGLSDTETEDLLRGIWILIPTARY